ncbi:uncharacterized protein BDV17DRAFT_163657 [Aspergillus undulatus]|uniref:uncharacterized protein n=1 Tax=Aspergillus undulatus TaxID=1810928 RepID=UPI003CCD541F
MDHVDSVTDSPYPTLQIPCLSREPYDGHDFLTYPERSRWDINRLLAGDFSQHEDAASFLQNWLFFGVLWEVFGPVGKGAKHNYVKPQEGYEHGTITVASLDEQILELMNFITSTVQSGNRAGAESVGHRIETCLRTVSKFCRIATCEGDPRPGLAVWPLSPEIDLSIRALSQRLAWSFSTGAMNMVFSSSTGGLVFSCAWLPLQRMQKSGWCTSEVAMVEETFTSASAYYISQLQAPPSARQKDHSECTRNLCMARQLNEATYRTAHSPPPHTTVECDCQHYGPVMDDVVSILETGGVPLLSITPLKKEPYVKVEVEKYTEGKRYIAFSHVWSDGLGNPTANTLPQCQLQRIHSLLDELVSGIKSIDLMNRLAFRELWKKKFHGPSLLFWMDTMCIPVAEEHKELRGKAIKSMKAVYERAFRVLVLDADIQSFPSADYTQAFMRIRLAAWMRRLWTLNEGVLANHLCIKFADGFLDVQARAETQQKDTYGSELENIKRSYGTPMRDADNFHWKFCLLRINVISEPDPRMVKRTEQSLTSPEAKRCFAIMEAFSAALYRSTSKERDEMLCFASLIGWDTSLLKGLEFKDHMHALLSTESQLPQGMLFLAGPRMHQCGWRWAINRFGNCGAKRLNVKSDDMTPGLVTEEGFVVDYPAVVLPAVYTTEQLERITMSVDLGDGIVGTFEIKRHDEGLAGEARDEPDTDEYENGQLYALFWDASRTMAPTTPMPAAVIRGPSEEDLAKGDVVYRLDHLAYLEILDKGEQLPEKCEVAQLVRKQWTIG